METKKLFFFLLFGGQNHISREIESRFSRFLEIFGEFWRDLERFRENCSAKLQNHAFRVIYFSQNLSGFSPRPRGGPTPR